MQNSTANVSTQIDQKNWKYNYTCTTRPTVTVAVAVRHVGFVANTVEKAKAMDLITVVNEPH